jgi:hypothetical protein
MYYFCMWNKWSYINPPLLSFTQYYFLPEPPPCGLGQLIQVDMVLGPVLNHVVSLRYSAGGSVDISSGMSGSDVVQLLAEKTHRLGYQRGLITWKQNGSSWISTVHYLYFQVRITIDLGRLNYIWIIAMNTRKGLLIPTDFGTGVTTRPESWCRNISKSNDVKLNLPLANILFFQHYKACKTLW